MNIRNVAGALSFAHLAGLVRPRANDEDKDYPDEDDGKLRRGARRADTPDGEPDRDDGDEEDNEPKGRRARRARRAEDGPEHGDDGDPEDDEPSDQRAESAPDHGDDGDPDSGGMRRRARRAEQDDGEDEDDDPEEMNGRSAAASARRRERARCAAILSSKLAARNLPLACSLAFETSLSRRQALAVLRNGGAVAGVSDRGARNARLGPGGEPGRTSPQAVSASWDRAFAKAGKTAPSPGAGWDQAMANAASRGER